MVKPNLFIPGFAKSGTSSFHAMLIKHPDISGGRIKEPHTYSDSYKYRVRFDQNKKSSFLGLYEENKSKYYLDSSTTYSVYKKALLQIKKDTPNAKFILLGRDPIERIVSHYYWLGKNNTINLPFMEEIKEYGRQKFDPSFHFNGNYKNYIDFSSYGKHLNNIEEIFGKGSFLFFKYEELFEKWPGFSTEIWDFLGVPNCEVDIEVRNKTIDLKKKKNLTTRLKRKIKEEYMILSGKKVRSQKIHDSLRMLPDISIEDLQKVFYYLKGDIDLFLKLGYSLDHWETTKWFYNNL
jgi:hypothetical protein